MDGKNKSKQHANITSLDHQKHVVFKFKYNVRHNIGIGIWKYRITFSFILNDMK